MLNKDTTHIMTTIFNKKEITDDEYIYKYALIYLGMKRIKDE